MSSAVRLIEVSHIYDVNPPVRALINVNLSISAGEYVALVGPSGCGKSTLLQLVGLLDRPTSGTIEVLGTDSSSMSDRRASHFRAEQIAFVFQAFHLIPNKSLLENVVLPLKYSTTFAPHERAARALHCLERVGLANRASALPLQLSGGEQQRVAFARALAPAPRLLLCDEPTGNLDAETTLRILDVVDDLRRREDFTVVVATHDSAVSDRAEQVISLASSGAARG